MYVCMYIYTIYTYLYTYPPNDTGPAFTAQLICAFVFAYKNIWFSPAKAQLRYVNPSML